MMISDEQARLAARALAEGAAPGRPTTRGDVPQEVIERARDVVERTPDIRAERVLEACTRLLTHPLDSEDLADKILNRIISDTLR